MHFSLDDALLDTAAGRFNAPSCSHKEVRSELSCHVADLRPESFQTLSDAYFQAVDEHLAANASRRFELSSLLDGLAVIGDTFRVSELASKTFITRSGYRVDLAPAFHLANRLIGFVNHSLDGTYGNTAAAVRHSLGLVLRARVSLFGGLANLCRAAHATSSRHLVEGLVERHLPENIELFLVMLSQAGPMLTESDDMLARYLRQALEDAGLYFESNEVVNRNFYHFRSYLALLITANLPETASAVAERYWALGREGSTHDEGALRILGDLPAHSARVLEAQQERLRDLSDGNADQLASLRSTIAGLHADNGRFDEAASWLTEATLVDPTSSAVLIALARGWQRIGYLDECRRVVSLARRALDDEWYRTPYASTTLNVQLQIEELSVLVDFYEETRRLAPTILSSGEFWWSNSWSTSDTGEFLSGRPDFSDTDLLVGNAENCINSVGLATFPLGLLVTAGARVGQLTSLALGFESRETRHRLDFATRSNENIERHWRVPHFEWIIDVDDERVECMGINFYQPIFERIARIDRSFHVDMAAPYHSRVMQNLILRCDRVLYFLEALREDASKEGRCLAIMALQPQFAPWSTFRDYAAKHPESFSFIHVTSAYENWLQNRTSGTSSTIAVVNLTRSPEVRTATFGTRRNFDRFWEGDYQRDRRQYDELIDKNLDQDRTRQSQSSEVDDLSASWRQRVDDARDSGRRVYCALGKIPYDLAVPTMGGPTHHDIADWINHTIVTFRDSEDLLLVKPHPHEIRMSISQSPNEGFLDLIDSPLSSNIAVLGHLDASLQELAQEVDVFLAWNGTAILELGAMGAVVVACDQWSARDYHVGVPLPADRAEYEAWLRDPTLIPLPLDFAQRCRGNIAFLGSDWAAIQHPWFQRSSSNLDFNRPTYDQHSISYEKTDPPTSLLRILDEFKASS